MLHVAGGYAKDKQAASASEIVRLETEALTQLKNLSAPDEVRFGRNSGSMAGTLRPCWAGKELESVRKHNTIIKKIQGPGAPGWVRVHLSSDYSPNTDS